MKLLDSLSLCLTGSSLLLLGCSSNPAAVPTLPPSGATLVQRILASPPRPDPLVSALLILQQDAAASDGVRHATLQSLMTDQPNPPSALTRLRRIQLALLLGDDATAQKELGVLTEDGSPEANDLLPLTRLFDRWSTQGSGRENQLQFLSHQNQELQGRVEVLARQIQELRTIEKQLVSRPSVDHHSVPDRP